MSTRPIPRKRRPRRHKWLGTAIVVLFAVTIGLPVAVVLLYRVVPPPTTPLMLGTSLWAGPIATDWVPLSAISVQAVKAVIAAEDGKFCSHRGFDWRAIEDAIAYNEQGRGIRGASTISQQTAKNLFLPPSRNWVRKGVEAYFTVLIETLWPKRRIMETYLNIIEFGPGIFGVEAAARAYFGTSAAELTRAEAARLASVLPNPKRYRADDPGPYVAGRSQRIAEMMADVTRDRLDLCVVTYAS